MGTQAELGGAKGAKQWQLLMSHDVIAQMCELIQHGITSSMFTFQMADFIDRF